MPISTYLVDTFLICKSLHPHASEKTQFADRREQTLPLPQQQILSFVRLSAPFCRLQEVHCVSPPSIRPSSLSVFFPFLSSCLPAPFNIKLIYNTDEKLGLGWGNSLLAFIALAMVPLPFAFIRWGEHIRERYKVEL